jgi:hypothetical protein
VNKKIEESFQPYNFDRSSEYLLGINTMPRSHERTRLRSWRLFALGSTLWHGNPRHVCSIVDNEIWIVQGSFHCCLDGRSLTGEAISSEVIDKDFQTSIHVCRILICLEFAKLKVFKALYLSILELDSKVILNVYSFNFDIYIEPSKKF